MHMTSSSLTHLGQRRRDQHVVSAQSSVSFLTSGSLSSLSKHVLNAQVSIRAPCCKQWFDCPECHAECESHRLAKTTEMVFMCKKCRKAFRKDMSIYDESDEYCPHCDNHYVRFSLAFTNHEEPRILGLFSCIWTGHWRKDTSTNHRNWGWRRQGGRQVWFRCRTCFVLSIPAAHRIPQNDQRRSRPTRSDKIHI